MNVSLRLNGGQDIARRLQQLPQALSRRVQVEALRAAAEPIRTRAAELAPYDADAGPPHLRDNIAIGTVSARSLEARGRESETVVEVGPELQPDDLFYGYFQEFGTAHHPAQAFMRPAFDALAPRALSVLTERLWAGLRAALPSSFGGRSVTSGRL